MARSHVFVSRRRSPFFAVPVKTPKPATTMPIHASGGMISSRTIQVFDRLHSLPCTVGSDVGRGKSLRNRLSVDVLNEVACRHQPVADAGEVVSKRHLEEIFHAAAVVITSGCSDTNAAPKIALFAQGRLLFRRFLHRMLHLGDLVMADRIEIMRHLRSLGRSTLMLPFPRLCTKRL